MKKAWIWLFFALVLARLPFYYTGNIQTDAFITWRCAENLAETGVYGYNPGERSSASTSHLYVLVSAGFFKIFGRAFLPYLLIFNAALLVLGLWHFARALLPDWPRQWGVWVLACLMPVSFQASTMGMETALLVFLLGLAVEGSAGKGPVSRAALLACFLLPWTRPDALAFGALILAWKLLRDRNVPRGLAVSLAAGALSLLAFNLGYFGQLLNQTMVGKSLCFKPSHALPVFLANVREVFAGGQEFNPGIYSPLFTRHLIPLRELMLAAAFGGFWMAWKKFGGRGFLLILMALLPPLAYAFGGILFYWYLWPSAIIANVLLLAWLRERFGARMLAPALALASVLACLQFMHAFKEGGHEYHMRDIGMDIGSMAKPGDTLFLEPAGAPAFYSGLHSWDSIGLTSPLVTDYQKKFGDGWFMAFLRDRRPTYILQGALSEIATCGAELDAVWFAKHYKLRKTWVFDPAEYYDKKGPGWRLVKDRPAHTWYLYSL